MKVVKSISAYRSSEVIVDFLLGKITFLAVSVFF